MSAPLPFPAIVSTIWSQRSREQRRMHFIECHVIQESAAEKRRSRACAQGRHVTHLHAQVPHLYHAGDGLWPVTKAEV